MSPGEMKAVEVVPVASGGAGGVEGAAAPPPPPKAATFGELVRAADGTDRWLMAAGTLGAMAAGAALPLF